MTRPAEVDRAMTYTKAAAAQGDMRQMLVTFHRSARVLADYVVALEQTNAELERRLADVAMMLRRALKYSDPPPVLYQKASNLLIQYRLTGDVLRDDKDAALAAKEEIVA